MYLSGLRMMEWITSTDGCNLRFGMSYVDFTTEKQYAKLSAMFYQEVIRRNAVV